VQLNYLDRVGRRSILVNTVEHTIEADFVKGILLIDRDATNFKVERDDTYRAMHEALLAGDFTTACRFEEGMSTMSFIDGARVAAQGSKWVANA
jgi:hypothetical protein